MFPLKEKALSNTDDISVIDLVSSFKNRSQASRCGKPTWMQGTTLYSAHSYRRPKQQRRKPE
eukprot:2059113-Rhodomonas_salina.4